MKKMKAKGIDIFCKSSIYYILHFAHCRKKKKKKMKKLKKKKDKKSKKNNKHQMQDSQDKSKVKKVCIDEDPLKPCLNKHNMYFRKRNKNLK